MRRVLGMALVGIVATSLALGVACTAGASSTPSKSQLRSKALSLSNFPAGWTIDNQSDSGGATGTPCLKNLKVPGKHDTQIEVKFADGSPPPALEEDIDVGPSIAKKYSAFTRQLGSCKGISFTDDGSTYHGTVGAMSFPKIGSESAAYSASIDVQGVTVGLDLVAFKTGKYIASVVYEDLGTPDLDTFEAFVTEAANKLEGKPTTTPTTF